MHISTKHLKKYLPALPATITELQSLCADIGLEIKRSQAIGDDVVFTFELLANQVTSIKIKILEEYPNAKLADTSLVPNIMQSLSLIDHDIMYLAKK